MKKFLMIFSILLAFQFCFSQWSSDPTVNNVVCNLGGEQAIPKTAICADGSFYIAWFSNDAGNYDVRAQYYDVDGNEQWEANGLLVSDNPQMTWLTQWDICSDMNGNLILSFQDTRYHDNPDIMVYKIEPDGTFAWGDDGIAITNDATSHMVPTVAATQSGYIIVAWIMEDGIGMQKVAADGTLMASPYFELTDTEITYTHPQIVPVENDCFILKYYKDTGPTWAPTRHLHAMKYEGAFEEVWDAECNISTQGGISAWTQRLSISPDDNGGFAICWNDDRDSDNMSEIYVQWVSGDGSTVYTDGGVIASTNQATQGFYSFVVTDPEQSTVMVFWNEMDGDQNMRGLSGQRLDQNGDHIWGNNGAMLIAMGSDNPYPFGAQLVQTVTGQGNALLFYLIDSGDPNCSYIKAMRVDSDGEMPWMGNSEFVCQVSSDKVHPVVSAPNGSYCFAAWEDGRNGSSDIYAQNISFNGDLGPVAPPSGISGLVILNGGEGNVEDVAIQIGDNVYHPGADGLYYILLAPGTYSIQYSLEGYETETLEGIEVVEGEIHDGVDAVLEPVVLSGISGTVTLQGGTGSVEDVAILIGEDVYHPGADGVYLIYLDPGTYSAEFSLQTYETVTVEMLNVTVGVILEDVDVTLQFVEASGDGQIAPYEFDLAIHPNPFNPMTNIAWTLSEPADVRVKVYDVRGRKVFEETRYHQPEGKGSLVLDANGFGSGVYFVRLNAGGQEIIRKAVLLK